MVPIVNISLLIKEFMAGHYLWLETAHRLCQHVGAGGGALWWATSQFRQEAVLFRHAEEIRWSPLRLFRRRKQASWRFAARRRFRRREARCCSSRLKILLLTAISARAGSWSLATVLLASQAAIVLPAF